MFLNIDPTVRYSWLRPCHNCKLGQPAYGITSIVINQDYKTWVWFTNWHKFDKTCRLQPLQFKPIMGLTPQNGKTNDWDFRLNTTD